MVEKLGIVISAVSNNLRRDNLNCGEHVEYPIVRNLDFGSGLAQEIKKLYYVKKNMDAEIVYSMFETVEAYKLLMSVVELNQQGLRNKEIAGKLGMLRETVSSAYKKKGTTSSEVSRQLIRVGLERNIPYYEGIAQNEESYKKLQDIVELNQQGLTNTEIAEKLKILGRNNPRHLKPLDQIHVNSYLKKAGLKLNPAGLKD